MQRLTLMLFEKILSATSWVPSLPPHQFIHPLSAPNPLLEEPSLPRAEDQRRFFVIQLLHIASHSDTCVSAIVSERASCTLCCPYDVICYHWLYDEALTKSQKIQLLTQFHDDSNHITRCTMHIRADGHGASYSAMITAEEAVYTLRAMMKNPEWSEVMAPLFVKIVLLAEASLNEEKEEQLWAEPAPFSSPRTTSGLTGVRGRAAQPTAVAGDGDERAEGDGRPDAPSLHGLPHPHAGRADGQQPGRQRADSHGMEQ